MNTNDLPLAQKLAALMEAGRAAHPNVRHARRAWGDGQSSGCAMTFAAMGAGVPIERGDGYNTMLVKLANAMGVEPKALEGLMTRVVEMNDFGDASLEEIIAAVREEKLPSSKHMIWLDEYSTLVKSQLDAMKYWVNPGPIVFQDYQWVSVDLAAEPKILTGKVSDKHPKPANVRVNAKTGATWPKPKRAYA